MGVLPLEFHPGQSSTILGLSGHERFTISFSSDIGVGDEVTVKAERADRSVLKFKARSRIDTRVTYLLSPIA